MVPLSINRQPRTSNAEPATPLLWVLRDELNLTGTKFGCGIAACGACAVLIDGAPVRSCVVPLKAASGREITTIEGVAATRWRAVQTAWVQHQVAQCGYCQSGMIMAVIGVLAANPAPTRDEIRNAVTNLCRCGTYQRVEDAALAAARALERA